MVELKDDLKLALDRVAFAESLGVVPDDWQAVLLRRVASRMLLNITRQGGKSTIAAVIALHRALYTPGSLVLVLAPAERQSKELFGKIAAFYRTIAHEAPAPDSARKLGMALPNGSRIEALPGSEKTIRGFSGVNLLILDEASRIDDALYHSVRPMLAVSGGSLMMLTTPYGKRGVFYEAWTGGEDWTRVEVPAFMCPRISTTFLEEERKALPARVYRQEYECSFEETEDQVFSFEEIESAMSDEVTPLFGEAG